MLSSTPTEAMAVEVIEDEIFALHLRRQVVVQAETTLGYLLATQRTCETEASRIAGAVATLRAHRPARQSKRRVKAAHTY